MEKIQVTPYYNTAARARQLAKKSLTYVKQKGKQNMIIVGATFVLFMLFTLINTGFADKGNLLTMTQSLAPYAILGLGVTFVIATGGIDLSIGTVCIASGVIAGTFYMKGMPLALTIPIMIVVGLGFGLLNGFLVAKLKLPAFIATLGTMMFSRGLSAIIAKVVANQVNINYPVSTWFQKAFANLNNFPIAILWVIGLAAICMYVMYKCKVGRYILAIGSNEEAARLSGINTARYKILAYAIGGTCAGIAAIFFAAANPTLTTASGNGMELDAIAGVYIGGTSSTGGIASILGSVLGAMILVIIRQGLNFALTTFDIPVSSTHITYAITGIIVVAAVLMDVIKTKSLNKVRTEKTAEKYKKQKIEEMDALKLKRDEVLSVRVAAEGEITADMKAKQKAENIAAAAEITAEINKIKDEMNAALPSMIEADKKAETERKRIKLEAKLACKAQKASK